ncbi:hypothetical protein [Kingella potus]|uniref:hypothetical protein n=1 Tax=Kingella potus TaxID=265175 RepID=UPI001FD52AA8|nr:hypothetical protein [Kingella potus]UOP01971.1 hypothetical protein LVJ84_02555 [Kingella potus]
MHVVFVFGIGKKADVCGFGLIQRPHGTDGDVFAAHLAAEFGRDLGKGVGLAHMRFERIGNGPFYVFRRPQIRRRPSEKRGNRQAVSGSFRGLPCR